MAVQDLLFLAAVVVGSWLVWLLVRRLLRDRRVHVEWTVSNVRFKANYGTAANH